MTFGRQGNFVLGFFWASLRWESLQQIMEDPLASVCVFALAQGASPPTVLRMHDCVRCREMSHMLCIRNSYEEKNKKSPAKLQTGWIESRSSPLLLSETGLLTQTLEPHWVFYALNPEKPGPQCMLGRNFTATHGLQLGLGSASTLFRQSLFVNEKDDSLLCSFPFFSDPIRLEKYFHLVSSCSSLNLWRSSAMNVPKNSTGAIWNLGLF